jgi:cytochrome c oxidase subunit 3
MTDAETVLAPQFEDLEQQRETSELGMWLFLATEVLFFGGFFFAYFVYRFLYAEAFAAASQKLELACGTINTVVLLTSSLTMAFALGAIQKGNRRQSAALLAMTMLFGLGFLCIKAYEYHHAWVQNYVPGFRYTQALPPASEIFFWLYFGMTGLHAIHLLVGMCVLGVLAVRIKKFSEDYFNPVEVAGLYWHFVDIIWVFLYPLLYLIRP